ncbi:MAG: hypothetical protein JSW07_15920 [bacterium]|nr:MAG: hypothetical protein JSW07_15920 [bacterium]
MNLDDLREEIEIEFEHLETIVNEILKLREELAERNPTIRDITVTGAFLAQFYNGIENILKRFYKYMGVSLQRSYDWYITIFKAFCDPPYNKMPLLFSKNLESKLVPFRKFRHVFHHGYGFQLDWERMKPGIGQIKSIFTEFKKVVEKHLKELKNEK